MDSIRAFLDSGAETTLSGSWQLITAGTRPATSNGLLVRNASLGSWVEVHITNSGTYGLYSIPPNSTFVVPISAGAGAALYVLGVTGQKVFATEVRVDVP